MHAYIMTCVSVCLDYFSLAKSHGLGMIFSGQVTRVLNVLYSTIVMNLTLVLCHLNNPIIAYTACSLLK